MKRSAPMHPTDMEKLYSGTLTDLRWARIVELTDAGFNEREADYFARIQIEEMKKLALELGPQRALLSTLHHKVDEKCRWSCSLRYTPPPKNLTKLLFHGFEN